MNIGFIGTGKMATAIARGLIRQQAWPGTALFGVDVSAQARAEFTASTSAPCLPDLAALAAKADILILAVKPQDAAAAAEQVAPHSRDKLIISIAAGLTLEKLCAWLGHRRIVRVMPNTPATVGQGVTVYACAPAVTETDKQLTERIFGAVGMVRPLPEELLNAATALSGSGPAYVFEVMQALIKAGTEVGLEPGLARELTAQTMLGSAAMVLQNVGSPEQLRDAVTSPGGTTEAGLRILRKGKLEELLSNTVRAARDRARELA